jgi:hypothetical protein
VQEYQISCIALTDTKYRRTLLPPVKQFRNLRIQQAKKPATSVFVIQNELFWDVYGYGIELEQFGCQFEPCQMAPDY